MLSHDCYLLCCGWARKNPQCLISMFVHCRRYYFLVFVWHVRTLKLLMISGASRSPLMTAFAELIERADPPSVPYHRVSGLRGRNPLWYTFIALHLLLFSLKGKYKVEFRDSKNPRACTAQNSRQIRLSVLYKLTFILHDLLVSVMSFCLHFSALIADFHLYF